MSPDRTPTVIYIIRVRGCIGARWEQRLDGLAITADKPGETRLAGPVVDQAALLGVLQKLHNLGLLILEVRVEDSVWPEARSCAGEEED